MYIDKQNPLLYFYDFSGSVSISQNGLFKQFMMFNAKVYTLFNNYSQINIKFIKRCKADGFIEGDILYVFAAC